MHVALSVGSLRASDDCASVGLYGESGRSCMIQCTFAPTCAFFTEKMKNMPSTVELIKKRYCFDDHLSCARFIVQEKLGADRVPDDLFPSQKDRALKLAVAKSGR